MLKRKGSDDIGIDAGVALPKRYRLDPDLPLFKGTNADCYSVPEEMVDFQGESELQAVNRSVQIVELDSQGLESEEDVNSERALVLYKPVSPPLFPGGPALGSSELPLRFNSNFFPEALRRNKGILSDFFRYRSPVISEWSEGTIDNDNSEQHRWDSNLAMVPWMPSAQPKCLEAFSGSPNFHDEKMPQKDMEIPTAMEEDAVDMMEEDQDPVQQQQQHPSFSCNSAANELGAADGFQWQHFLPSQTPLNPPVMWSC